MAALSGVKVIATASADSARRAERSGAALVVDYRSPTWPAEVRYWTDGEGVDAAVNAVPGQAKVILDLVRDNGRLATITSDAPASVRGIQVSQIYVAPDGPRLQRLIATLASGELNIETSVVYPLADAAKALEQVRRGSGGGTIILDVNGPE
jgi:NADPH:quinone reductase-like Zn-dependent oxidoreductase